MRLGGRGWGRRQEAGSRRRRTCVRGCSRLRSARCNRERLQRALGAGVSPADVDPATGFCSRVDYSWSYLHNVYAEQQRALLFTCEGMVMHMKASAISGCRGGGCQCADHQHHTPHTPRTTVLVALPALPADYSI